MTDRLDKLRELLTHQPNDAFLLYAMAMEYKKLGQAEPAMEYLRRVLAVDAKYCVAYHQAGLVAEMTGDLDAAKKWYRDGIAAANAAGDAHAAGEMQQALDEIAQG